MCIRDSFNSIENTIVWGKEREKKHSKLSVTLKEIFYFLKNLNMVSFVRKKDEEKRIKILVNSDITIKGEKKKCKGFTS